MGVIRLAPSQCGTADSSSSISSSTKVQHPMSALCFKKGPHSALVHSWWLRAVGPSPLNCYIYGKTDLYISNYSNVCLSGKFEQLESPSSVSDLRDFTRPDEYSIFFNLLKIQNFSSWLGQSRTSFSFTFSVISNRVLKGRAYPSFLPLWIVMCISRVFNKTMTQRPLLVIEKDLPKIAALWPIGFGTMHTCLLSLSSS